MQSTFKFIYFTRFSKTPPYCNTNGANTNATTVINFTNIFNDGPEVSLNGSPTVSPTTPAL